jgi:hypothetical protein
MNGTDEREGTGVIVWVAVALVASMLMLVMCGCASDRHKPSADYPFPKMLDPVTEEVPDVQVK